MPLKKSHLSEQLCRISLTGLKEDTDINAIAPLADDNGRVYVLSTPAVLLPDGSAIATTLNQTRSNALLIQRNISLDPAILLQCFGYNSNAAQRYVQLFDIAGPVVNGAVPEITIPVPGGNSNFSVSPQWSFQNGITIAISTTGPTLTLSATNDLWFNAQFLTS
jgi:hypothetical protein